MDGFMCFIGGMLSAERNEKNGWNGEKYTSFVIKILSVCLKKMLVQKKLMPIHFT